MLKSDIELEKSPGNNNVIQFSGNQAKSYRPTLLSQIELDCKITWRF